MSPWVSEHTFITVYATQYYDGNIWTKFYRGSKAKWWLSDDHHGISLVLRSFKFNLFSWKILTYELVDHVIQSWKTHFRHLENPLHPFQIRSKWACWWNHSNKDYCYCPIFSTAVDVLTFVTCSNKTLMFCRDAVRPDCLRTLLTSHTSAVSKISVYVFCQQFHGSNASLISIALFLTTQICIEKLNSAMKFCYPNYFWYTVWSLLILQITEVLFPYLVE